MMMVRVRVGIRVRVGLLGSGLAMVRGCCLGETRALLRSNCRLSVSQLAHVRMTVTEKVRVVQDKYTCVWSPSRHAVPCPGRQDQTGPCDADGPCTALSLP